MDTDGDKVYLTSEEIIINAVKRNLPMVYGDVAPKKKPKEMKWGTDGYEAICIYDSFTLTPSQIGTVTNYCTALVDQARDPRYTQAEVAERWELVVLGRDVQGKVIDSAKTGNQVDIPESLKQELYPHWLKDLSRAGVKELYETGEFCNAYVSTSPMGRLYDYVVEVACPALKEKFTNTQAPTVKILAGLNYDLAEVENLVPAIEMLERHYRLEMSDFFENNPEEVGMHLSGEEYKAWKKERSARIGQLVLKHKNLLGSLEFSTLSIAVACLHVAELAEDRSHTKACSYPYVVAGEYMEAMLSHVEGNYKLVRVNAVDEDIWVGEAVVEDNRIVDVSGETVGYVNVADGVYDTFESNGNYFVKLPIAKREVENFGAVKEAKVQFSIKGWKFYDKSATPEHIMNLISTREVTTEMFVGTSKEYGEKELVALVLDGKRVATLGEEADIVAFNILQKSMIVTGVKQYKGILMVDATVKGEAPKVEYSPIDEPAPSVSDDAYYMESLLNDEYYG